MCNHYNAVISRDFLCHLESIFQEVDRHLPSFTYNACGECSACCTSYARLGVSELEYEYIGVYLQSKGRSNSELSDFRDYIQKRKTVDSHNQDSRDKNNRDQQSRDQQNCCIEETEEAAPEKTYENRDSEPFEKSLKFDRCPLYDEQLKGCSIYPARPLSCRTYGYFMNRSTISLIPDYCALKPTTVLYDDTTFFQHLPFCVPFYSLIYSYDDFMKREQEWGGKQEQL